MPTILAQRVCKVKWAQCIVIPMDSETLRAAARKNQRDKTREGISYAALLDAIWQASDEGMRPADIVRAVDLTRERIRQICDSEYRMRTLERREQVQR